MQLLSWTEEAPRIAVLISCFNRKQKIIACIDAVLAQSARGNATFDLYVTDDGSPDGMAELLLWKYPAIHLCRGSVTRFWNGGMRLAWQQASQWRHDFYLWLNEDTFLYRDAVQTMLDAHARGLKLNGRAGIVAGATEDQAGRVSHGGERQKNRWFLPLTLITMVPNGQLQACDTFHGNCVLVSLAAAETLGNLDGGFVHAMGDTDYGLRARRLGVPVWLAPGFVGQCVNADRLRLDAGTDQLSFVQRWKSMFSPTILPWRPWTILCRRHGGVVWPVVWLWPYVKMSVALLFSGRL